MNESEFKTKVVKKIKEQGGYGRRFEDQYAVGVYDMILIPKEGPVFFVEAKIIKATTWGPSPRQKVELERVAATDTTGLGYAVPCLMGFNPDTNRVTVKGLGNELIVIRDWKSIDVTEMLRTFEELNEG